MLSHDDRLLLDELRQRTTDVLASELGEEPEVILLGTPRHRNLGDTLIWAGERAYLARLGRTVVYQANSVSYRDAHMARLPTTAPILIHGGGNLGDLYPHEEEFRLHIIRTFPGRRVISLPQSVRFGSLRAAAESEAVYSRAHRLTVLLRDTASAGVFGELMPSVASRFCPDLALGADIALHQEGETSRIRVLARSDSEAAAADSGVPAQDWRVAPPGQLAWVVLSKTSRALSRLPDPIVRPLEGVEQALTAAMLSLNVFELRRQLDGVGCLVTNRLHAHILACLAGVPHWVSDNSCGKISAVYRDYTGRFSTAHLAASIEAALQELGVSTAGQRRIRGGRN